MENDPLNDMPYLPPDFVNDFILKYRTYQCLWKKSIPEYKNGNLKRQAYKELVEFVKKTFPNADIKFVIKIQKTIQREFGKERKRVLESIEKGENPIYKPTLYYYESLLFTVKNENTSTFDDPCEETISSIDQQGDVEVIGSVSKASIIDAKRLHATENIIDLTELPPVKLQDSASNVSSFQKNQYDDTEDIIDLTEECTSAELKGTGSNTSTGANQYITHNIKDLEKKCTSVKQELKFDEEVTEVTEFSPIVVNVQSLHSQNAPVSISSEYPICTNHPFSNRMKRTSSESDVNSELYRQSPDSFISSCYSNETIDESQLTGITVATKLRKMDPVQVILAESLINKILAKGLLNSLTANTDVFDKR